MVVELNDDNFKSEVIDSDTPVLVDFWATWCGPCKMLTPIVEEVAEEYKDKPVKVGKMEVDSNEQTPGQYQIMSVPTLIVFKNGEPMKQMIGVQSKEDIKAALDEAMG